MARTGFGKRLGAGIAQAKIRSRLTYLLSCAGGYDGTVLLNLGDDGTLLVDRRNVSVSDRQKLAQASLTIATPDLDQFLLGQINTQMLLMTRRLTIAGRMADALRFARHLEISIHGRSALPV